MSEPCRGPTCRRGGDPEADKENEAGESIGHGHKARVFSLTGLAFSCAAVHTMHLLGSPWFSLQPRRHAILRNAQDSLDVDEPSLGKVVEVPKTMFERSPARRIFHRESYLLQRDSSVLVLAEHLDARFLERTKQTPLTRSFVVLALAIVPPVPHRLVLEQAVSFLENPQVVRRHRKISLFQLWAG